MSKPVVLRCDDGSWIFHCPGCKHAHSYDHRWTMTGTPEAPTFTPSLLVRCPDYGPEHKATRCHLYVRGGKIQFLSDCTHELAGQTVDMEPW